jgi:hypothetical protein
VTVESTKSQQQPGSSAAHPSFGSLPPLNEGDDVILSMAHAQVAEAEHDNMLGEWSDLVVGEKPDGLVAAYLVSDGDNLRIASVWHNADAHDRALQEEGTHPAFKVFEAAGLDHEHSVMRVIGSFTS